MASLQCTAVTGSTQLYCTNSNTAAQGYVWYDRTIYKLSYTSFNGSTIVTCQI